MGTCLGVDRASNINLFVINIAIGDAIGDDETVRVSGRDASGSWLGACFCFAYFEFDFFIPESGGWILLVFVCICCRLPLHMHAVVDQRMCTCRGLCCWVI